MTSLPETMLFVSNLGFLIALLPMLRSAWQGNTTLTLWGSVPTTLFLVNSTVAMFMLDLPWAAGMTFCDALAWFALAILRVVKPTGGTTS